MTFENIWDIFAEAFPPELRRSREGQAALLKNPNYRLKIMASRPLRAQAFNGYRERIFEEVYGMGEEQRRLYFQKHKM